MPETWQPTDWDAVDARNHMTLLEGIAEGRCAVVPDPMDPACIVFRVTFPEGQYDDEYTDFADEMNDLAGYTEWDHSKVWLNDKGQAYHTGKMQDLEILQAIGTGRVYHCGTTGRGHYLFTYDPVAGDQYHFADGFEVTDLIDKELVEDLDEDLTPQLTTAGYKHVCDLVGTDWDA